MDTLTPYPQEYGVSAPELHKKPRRHEDQYAEINEEGFDVYFQGGLRRDEHFNAREYLLSISREENLSLSRSHASTIWKLVLRVLCQRTIGYDKMHKNDL
ncbi:hypothetical protein Tco_1052572 [Tanacetum coccineum]